MKLFLPLSQYFSEAKHAMEVEVKLRLVDATSHKKLFDLIASFHIKTLLLENTSITQLLICHPNPLSFVFCLTTSIPATFSSSNHNRVSVASKKTKKKSNLLSGAPSLLNRGGFGSMNSRIIKRLRDKFGVGGESLVCLGV